MLAKKSKKLLALLVALVMCLGMLPLSAMANEPTAADEQAQQQIVDAGGTVYYDTEGNLVEGGVLGQDNVVVEMSKTVAATGVENEFEITLQVKTTQKLTEIPASTPDAAVILVMDVSNSMDDCVNCGKEKSDSSHNGGTVTTYYCHGNSGSTYEAGWNYRCRNCRQRFSDHNAVTTTVPGSCAYRSRLADAQAAALEFLDQFANETGASGDDRRMVAVVSFGSNAKRELDWVDVRTEAGMEAAVAAVNGVEVAHGDSDNGGTNIEGGLMLAKNILNAGRQVETQIKDVNYLYTILLTDGNPTFYVDSVSSNTETIAGSRGGFNSTHKSDVQDVGTEADAIRGITSLSRLYSICFGSTDGTDVWDTKPFGDWRDTKPSTTENMTVGEWLAAFSTAAYNGQASGLFDTFDSIADQIATAAQAWRVTDIMGTDIRYDGAIPVPNKAGNGSIYNSVTLGEDGASFEWNILASQYDDNITEITVDKDGQMTGGVLGYTFRYRIHLNNVGENGAGVKDTNASATLKYMVADSNGNWPTDPTALKTGTFAVPQVKGYQAELTFTKVDPLGGALAIARFTLTPAPAGAVNYTGADTSEADGVISFANIPSGYTYTLTETAAPSGYETVGPFTVEVRYGVLTVTDASGKVVDLNGNTLTDPYQQSYVDVRITKKWQKPAGGATPEAITVILYQDDAVFGTYTIQKDQWTVDGDTWTYTFTGLPEKDLDTGARYTYRVEEQAMEGWTATYGDDGLSIVNTASGSTTLFVTKNWVLPEGMVAPVITVKLLANGKPTGKTQSIQDGQTVAFPNLPLYDEQGQPIEYSVAESLNGSYRQLSTSTQVVNGIIYVTLTNTVANETIDITGTKTWQDGGDAASRPASITVTLYQDGEATDQTAVATAEGGWTYSFEGLSRYAFSADGTSVREIAYTVVETPVEGYTSTVNGSDITNTRTGTVDLTVYKSWVAESGHPAEVEVQLYANGSPVGEAVTFTTSYTFTGLDRYDSQGEVIAYSLVETAVEGYTPSYSGLTTDEEGNYYCTITNTQNDADDTVVVTVTKTWQQPGSVGDQTATFYLCIDGVRSDYSVTITGNGSASFRPMLRYDRVFDEATGETTLVEIQYSVEEETPAGYRTELTGTVGPDSAGALYFHYTNVIEGTTSVTVEKTWVQPEGMDTPAATFNVLRSVDGQTWEQVGALTLQPGETSKTLGGLAQYDPSGRLYLYRVEEESIPGYSVQLTGGVQEDGSYVYQAVNTINQATAPITVAKTWIDGSAPNSQRPDVTIDLMQDGVAVASVTFYYDSQAGAVMASVTVGGVTASPVAATVEGNTWSVQIPDMPLYNEARTARYTYTVQELEVPGDYVATVNGTTVTNKLTGTVSIPITKYWVDPAGTADRPDVTLRLTGSDGSERVLVLSDDSGVPTVTLDGVSLDLTAEGGTWTFTVGNLPAYTSEGEKIAYTLTEDPVSGYTSAVEGFSVTNTIAQEQISIGAVKQWSNMDAGGVYTPAYPESITVALYRDGLMVEGSQQTVAVGEDGSCTIAPYTGLDKYNLTTGQLYRYEIFELDGEGNRVAEGGTISFGADNDYTVTYTAGDGVVTITNTFKTPAKYLWIVRTHYVHYDYTGAQIGEYHAESEIYTETESKTVSADPAAYVVCPGDGLTYVYDADNANVTEAVLTVQNHLYVLELYYELTDEIPYFPPVITPTYTVTVNYYDEDGNVIYTQYVSAAINAGGSWDVTGRQYPSIDVGGVEYRFLRAEGDPLSGSNIRANQVIDLYYAPAGVVDPEPTDPVVDPEPTDPVVDPEPTDPVVDPQPTDPVEDPQPADPNGGPQTGDNAPLLLLAALMALSGGAILTIVLVDRKKRT